MSKAKFLSLWTLIVIFLLTTFSQPALAYFPEQYKSDDLQISDTNNASFGEQLSDDIFATELSFQTSKDKLDSAQKKLSSDLLQLIEDDESSHSVSPTADTMTSRTLVMSSMDDSSNTGSNDLAYVYIYLNPDTPTSVLQAYVTEITDIDEEHHLAVARVKINMLSDIASLTGIRTIRKVNPPLIRKGSALTEGDNLHRADLLRQRMELDGTGMKVGIISNGVDHWQDAHNSGDLPADFGDKNILRNQVGGEEGTAMLEIVYDIAPGAELYFHDCGSNILQFNQAIDELVEAGCNIICDDISWLYEPFFEDGLIAQHVERTLQENNILYLSSAGNAAAKHYQGMFCNDGSNRHDFSAQSSDIKDLRLDIQPDSFAHVIMQWNDKFAESSNDYDFYAYNRLTGELLQKSNYSQDGNDDPIEAMIIKNNGTSTLPVSLAVEKYSGDDRELEIFIYPHGGIKYYPYNLSTADSIFGHPAVPEVIAVGAMNASDPGQLSSYSSRGPVKIYHPESEIRKKPDICGIDGVDITGAGEFPNPFYGTSAAAPHVAALAALSWSAAPNLSADEVRAKLLSSAIDLGEPGFDNLYGYGRADVINSVMTAVYADHLWVTDSNPLFGEVTAPVDQDIQITFSKDIRTGSSFDSISLLKEDGQAAPAEKNINGKTLLLSPESNLEYSCEYTINIPQDAVLDLSGTSMDADSSISFKTISEIVNIPDPGLKKAVMNHLEIINRDIGRSDMEKISWLNANNCSIKDLSGLEYAHNLKYLFLSDNQISNLDPISGLNQLNYLFLNNNQITDISALSGLQNLQNLSLSDNKIRSDLSVLKNLPDLRELSLSNTEADDISFLQDLSNLELLDLNGNNIDDISSLAGLSNLTTLYLCANNLNSDDLIQLNAMCKLKKLELTANNLTDITDLTKISTLESLKLDKNNIQNLPDLSGLSSLKFINLDENAINDISALQSLTQMEVFTINNNQLQTIPDLSGLTCLYGIDLGNNQINDISALQSLTQLALLGLNNNQLQTIPDLSSLKCLYGIDLSNNQINDISALQNLTQLIALSLCNNQITDISALEELYNLELVNLAENKITDISALVINSQGGNRNSCSVDLSNNFLDLSESSQTLQDLEYLLNIGVQIVFEPQQELSLPQINSAKLPDAFVNSPYSVKLQAIGGISPYRWAISEGQLPAGLSMTEKGVISGKAGTASESSFSLELADSSDPAKKIVKQFSINVYETAAATAADINFEPNTDCDLTLNGNKPLRGAIADVSEGNIRMDISQTSETDLNSLYSGWDEIYYHLFTEKPLPDRIPRLLGFSVNAPSGAETLEAYRNGQNVYASVYQAENLAVLEETAGYMVTGNQYKSDYPEDYNHFTILPSDEIENYWVLEWKDENGEILKAQNFTFTVQSPKELNSIINPSDIQVYTGTEFNDIALPPKVKAVLSDGSTAAFSVNWLKADYTGDKTGLYIVYGELQLSSGIINPQQLKAQLNIRVSSSSSEGSSGSSGGGGGAAIESSTVIKSDGGSVKKEGTTVEIPSGAAAEDIKVEIQKVDIKTVTAAPRSKLVGDVLEISKNKSGNFNKPVKISLSFDKSQVNTDKYQLSLFWFNEKTSQWVELDNVNVDVKNGLVSGEVEHFTKFAILAVEKNDIFITRNLSDIKDHWAEDYITNIVEKGIASGDVNGSFRPDDNISREEFCKFIVLAAGLDPVEKPELDFGDNSKIASWARPYVAAAVKAGIITGYEDKSFKPQRNVSRAEIAAMVMRAVKDSSEKSCVDFNDANTIPAWALNSVSKAVDKGIISGFPDHTFRAAEPATRAQAAKIISQMLKN